MSDGLREYQAITVCGAKACCESILQNNEPMTGNQYQRMVFIYDQLCRLQSEIVMGVLQNGERVKEH